MIFSNFNIYSQITGVSSILYITYFPENMNIQHILIYSIYTNIFYIYFIIFMNTVYTYKTCYLYLPTPPHKHNTTQRQFLCEVEKVLIQSFPSPILVAIPRLKSLISSTVYPKLLGEWLDSYLFKGFL